MRRTGARTAAIALSGTLLCGGLLSGCGSSGENDAASAQAQAPVAAAADAAAAPAADAGGDAAAAPAAGADAAVQAPAPVSDAAESADVAGDVASAAAPKSAKAARTAKTVKAAGKADPLQKGASSNAATSTSGSAPAATGASVKSAVPDTSLAGRDIIYTADMTVRVEDVGKAASKVEGAAVAAGGIVVGSQRTSEPGVASPKDKTPPPDRSEATLTLRVPPEEFDKVLNSIGGTGEVLDRTLTGKDVTSQVVDVTSRIDSQRKSVARIRDLMDRADTLKDIVSLESEVAQREADLDALLAKQAKLRDQSSLATITIHLLSKAAPVAVEDDSQEVGFAAGLHNGWDAFTGALAVAATVLGALLPFVVTLLVLGPPVAWFVARLRRAGATPRPNPDGPVS